MSFINIKYYIIINLFYFLLLYHLSEYYLNTSALRNIYKKMENLEYHLIIIKDSATVIYKTSVFFLTQKTYFPDKIYFTLAVNK